MTTYLRLQPAIEQTRLWNVFLCWWFYKARVKWKLASWAGETSYTPLWLRGWTSMYASVDSHQDFLIDNPINHQSTVLYCTVFCLRGGITGSVSGRQSAWRYQAYPRDCAGNAVKHPRTNQDAKSWIRYQARKRPIILNNISSFFPVGLEAGQGMKTWSTIMGLRSPALWTLRQKR